ncbi:9921_t:CDS:2 [Paraglomus occultum]|uniref:9921_t:CDS:1 n=1 Tax=Paraglomus occultum TaxID=144539 RepID=A0A9N8WP31_9GLOM|nr:9921_t:CDS:2 [Paraglomus occultum]
MEWPTPARVPKQKKRQTPLTFGTIMPTQQRLWIYIEGTRRATKVPDELLSCSDLDLLALKLCQTFTALKNTDPLQLEFLFDGRSLPGDTELLKLITTAKAPLVIRYPLSDRTLRLRINLAQKWFKMDFPHETGLWDTINKEISDRWSSIIGASRIYLTENVKLASDKVEIINDSGLLAYLKTNDGKNEFSFSVQMRDKKPFSDWSWVDIQGLMKVGWSSYTDAPDMSLDELPQVDLSTQEIKLMLDELKKNKAAFKHVMRNEMTCREFISPFLTAAVRHLQSEEGNLQLNAEDELNGTRAYGSVDYTILSEGLIVCVTVVKKEETFEKGMAQNIAQMHTAVEKLGKRKADVLGPLLESESESLSSMAQDEVPILMYGIVSNASRWRFLQWAGPEADPTLQISTEFTCKFDDPNVDGAEQMLKHIASIIKSQIGVVKDPTKSRRVKRFKRQ